jgi:CRP-like cAMP-binding protein
MDLFRGLDAENIAKIFARGMTVEYQAGEVIFKKGQEGESLYLILNGSVAIADDGREIALLKQGDMFGEMALISQGKRSADAIAVNDVSLLTLKMDIINNIMPRDVSVQLLVNIIMTLSRRLQEANAG